MAQKNTSNNPPKNQIKNQIKKKLPKSFWVLIIVASVLVIFLVLNLVVEFFQEQKKEHTFQIKKSEQCQLVSEATITGSKKWSLLKWEEDDYSLLVSVLKQSDVNRTAQLSVQQVISKGNEYQFTERKNLDILCTENKNCVNVENLQLINDKWAWLKIKESQNGNELSENQKTKSQLKNFLALRENKKIMAVPTPKICEHDLHGPLTVHYLKSNYWVLNPEEFFLAQYFFPLKGQISDSQAAFTLKGDRFYPLECQERRNARPLEEALFYRDTLLVWPQKVAQFDDVFWLYLLKDNQVEGPKVITFPEFKEGFVGQLSQSDNLKLLSLYRVKTKDYINVLFEETYTTHKIHSQLETKNPLRFSIGAKGSEKVAYELGENSGFYQLSKDLKKWDKLFSLDNSYGFDETQIFSQKSSSAMLLIFDTRNKDKKILNLNCEG